MFKKNILTTIIILTILFLLTPIIIFAQGLVPCETIEHPEPCNLCHVFLMLQTLLNGVSIALFAFAAIMIVIGGITIMVSAGIPEQTSKGKKIITYAIIGVIIALLAWVIINETMLLLVGPGTGKGVQKLPWPWDKITCVPSEAPSGEEEKGNNKICCCDLEGDSYICSTYNSESECNADCQIYCNGYAAYRNCCVNTQKRCSSTPDPIGAKENCVCEVPVYDLDPNKDSNASVIGTNAKATGLSTQEECARKCISGYFNDYCPPTLKKDQANFYCATDSQIQSKKACAVYLYSSECQISTTCYNGENDCSNAGKTTYKQRCYLNGEFLCKCYTGAQKGLCGNSSSKYVLYRIKEETSAGGNNLFDCPTISSKNQYCRLNCEYDECLKEKENVCDEVKTFSCFGDKFTCKNMVERQKGTACPELEKLLNCLATDENYRIVSPEYRVITSISDNSPPSGSLSSLPGCFRQWTTQCSGTTDSCTGTCCGHSKPSFHYGGAPNNSSCRNCSWAVDFAIPPGVTAEITYNHIKGNAEGCASAEKLNYGKVDVIKHSDHIHVELDWVGKNLYKCGSGE